MGKLFAGCAQVIIRMCMMNVRDTIVIRVFLSRVVHGAVSMSRPSNIHRAQYMTLS
jgi:hypothetical protein